MSLVWILYALPGMLVNIPFVQEKIAQTATEVLQEKLGVPVRIGNVDIEWFNRLVIEELYLEDQEGKVLFRANHLAAGMDVLPLLEGHLVFNTVRLFGPEVYLSKQSATSPLNLQFVIDAFARKDTTPKPKPKIDLRFNTILIRQGHFRYDVEDVPRTPGKFNAKHVDIHNLSAKISLRALRNDSINAQVKKMSLDESAGFSLEKLSFSVVGNRDSIHLQGFEIHLPQTSLRIPEAKVDLSQVDTVDASLVDKAPLALKIAPSRVCLKDISAFVPAFRNFTDSIELSARADGLVNHINLENLTLKYGKKMLLVGRMDLRGITRPQDAFIMGQVNKMYITTVGLNDLLNNFSKDRVVLPPALVKLGTINFTGEISGFFNHLIAYGKLSTAIGSVQTDLVFGHDKKNHIAAFLKGRVRTEELSVVDLLKDNNPLGKAKCRIEIDASRPEGGHFAGKIQANVQRFDFKGYTYRDIRLDGNFRRNAFDGRIQLNDPNGTLSANGIFENQGAASRFDFQASVAHFRPDRLHLSEKYEEPDISFSMQANFTGNTIDNVAGNIQVDSLDFRTKPDSFFLKKFRVEASGHAADRNLQIASDIVNGEIKGAYSFATLVPSLLKTFESYLPALVHVAPPKREIKDNNFTLLLTVENTEAISQTLKLPFTVLHPARVTGSYDNHYNKFRFEAYLPWFRLGKANFEGGYLTCNNLQNQLELEMKTTNFNSKGMQNHLGLQLKAYDNCVHTDVQWSNNKEKTFRADLSASTCFVEEPAEDESPVLRTEVTLHQTPVIINDSIWHILPSKLLIRKGKVHVEDFGLAHDQEYLRLNGVVSKEPTDTLKMKMNNVELKYIFDILNIPAVQFAGKATGDFNICDLQGSRKMDTDLQVRNFSFNQVALGELKLFSAWDDAQRGILMRGNIYKNDTTWTSVDGYIYPVRTPERMPGLSLRFDANDINIAFLHPFMEKIAKNVRGHGFGKIHLYGPFKELTVEGDAYIKDGGLGIDFLDTYYTFSDSVHMDPTRIWIRDLTLYDKFKNAGKVNLTVNHKHFKNFDYHVGIEANNMLMYDVSEKHNPLIYGVVYGSGTAAIHGNGQIVNLDVNMQSRPNTHVYLNFMGNSRAEDYDFITFVDRKKLRKEAAEKQAAVRDSLAHQILNTEEEGAELRMNFLLDITPDANFELFIDPQAGDRIKGYGNGSLQIQWGTKSDLRMYGGYGIQEGNYNFSLQQLLHKDFKIRDGSIITFNGDPFNAILDINAIYNLTANLSDLDESLALESPRTNVPVNCVLNLDGMLRRPDITFDLELPGSNEELERQMKSFIDTDDMMTRQIVYLLILNRFYTPEYTGTTNSNDYFSAAASSALSSQLSTLLNSITDKVQIGTNIRAGEDWGIRETEVEMLLSSQLLNNRLLFNGNFGYKDTPLQKQAFIGEFDLEYKLTRNGDIRLKAYNHANDLYQYLKQSLTTQGVGIMFKKDFTRFSDLFQHRRRPLVLPPDSLSIPALPADSLQKK